MGLPWWLIKNLPTMQETWVLSLSCEDPWRREWLPTPVFLPGESHGQKNLAGYSPWGWIQSDTMEWLSMQALNLWAEELWLITNFIV